MTEMIKNYTLLVVVILLFNCGGNAQTGIEKQNNWLFKADPVADAQNSIEKEDFRILGLNGYNAVLPGVAVSCHILQDNIRIIEKTSHFHPSYSDAKLYALADIYAKYYNVRMLSHYQEKGWNICGSNRDKM